MNFSNPKHEFLLLFPETRKPSEQKTILKQAETIGVEELRQRFDRYIEFLEEHEVCGGTECVLSIVIECVLSIVIECVLSPRHTGRCVCVSVYIDIYVCVCVCIYIYIS